MDWSLVQPREYNDTFGGGEYHRDMQESPELLQSRLSVAVPIEKSYQSERQKKLRHIWHEKVCL